MISHGKVALRGKLSSMTFPMIEPTSHPMGAGPLFRQLADDIG
jgi:hypothetical protein